MAFLSCLFFSRSQYKKRFRRNASSHIHSTTLSCQRLSVCLDRFGSTTQMHQPNPCVNARGTSRQTKAKKKPISVATHPIFVPRAMPPGLFSVRSLYSIQLPWQRRVSNRKHANFLRKRRPNRSAPLRRESYQFWFLFRTFPFLLFPARMFPVVCITVTQSWSSHYRFSFTSP